MGQQDNGGTVGQWGTGAELRWTMENSGTVEQWGSGTVGQWDSRTVGQWVEEWFRQ